MRAGHGVEVGLIVEDHGALAEDGYLVLGDLYPREVVSAARDSVLKNRGLLRNTRARASSGHLAGFHRYPALEPLHGLLTQNHVVVETLERASGAPVRTIGLSDITVNRSQEWHIDLLRGQYSGHLDPDVCWGSGGGGVYKVLLYLQSGRSLRVVPGAHIRPVNLDSDQRAAPSDSSKVRTLHVEPGTVVLMDLRLPHRGSTEDELGDDGAAAAEPKILISTVFGAEGRPLTEAMERGNALRLSDWDAVHRPRAALQPA